MAIECPTRTIAPCAAGDGAACITPPVVVACTAELPCNEDIPYVVFNQNLASGDGEVYVEWEGFDASYDIEYLVAGKLNIWAYSTGGEPVTVYDVIHQIVDIGTVTDVATGNVGSMTLGGSLTEGYTYTVSLRRVTATAVGVWNQAFFLGRTDPFPIYVVDGDDFIVDGGDGIVQTPIIDGYP